MIKLKLFALALLLAIVLGVAGSSYAQAPQIVAVGSSGAFTSMVASMTLPDATLGYASAVCGTRVWTYSNATLIWAVDPRAAGIPNEPGNIAVVWDSDATPNNVCVYLSVDSIVGLRLLLGQSRAGGTAGNGFLHVDPSVSGTPGGTVGLAGQNKVGFVTDTVNNTCGPTSTGPCGLPPAVYALVNGAHFNLAFSDIRPDDGQYAYGRAACGPVDEISCFGYGPLNGIGTAILSSFNTNNAANTVAFAVAGGSDQFSHLNVPSTKVINIGAYPVMFFYNALDTAAGGLGALLPKNVLSHTIGGFFSGQLGLNQDLMGVPTTPLKALDIIEREAMSGTFNTFEFQGVHDRDGNTAYSQETGVFVPTNYGTGAACPFVVPSSPTYLSPVGNCSNPLSVPGLANRRFRAIGTGEMVSAVNNSPNGTNRLGYAFFSLGTFVASRAGNTRYMTLDGVDPLYPS